jgi:hypothetical protein
MWKVVPSCLMWDLWRGENDQSFKDGERTVVELKIVFFLQYPLPLDNCP